MRIGALSSWKLHSLSDNNVLTIEGLAFPKYSNNILLLILPNRTKIRSRKFPEIAAQTNDHSPSSVFTVLSPCGGENRKAGLIGVYCLLPLVSTRVLTIFSSVLLFLDVLMRMQNFPDGGYPALLTSRFWLKPS